MLGNIWAAWLGNRLVHGLGTVRGRRGGLRASLAPGPVRGDRVVDAAHQAGWKRERPIPRLARRKRCHPARCLVRKQGGLARRRQGCAGQQLRPDGAEEKNDRGRAGSWTL
ncbi:unnamed protein product [Ectocarpus fasciculatus]